MKPLRFAGDSLESLKAFPQGARRSVGFQLERVQHGLEPNDWKPMPGIGSGVREIRARDTTGAFRAIYVTSFAEAVYVLHCFQKKSQATPRKDIELAVSRFKSLLRERNS